MSLPCCSRNAKAVLNRSPNRVFSSPMAASTSGALAWTWAAMLVLLAQGDWLRSNGGKANQGNRPKGTGMRDVYMIGAHTTPFKKHPDKSFGDLAREAYLGALGDAGLKDGGDIETGWLGNFGKGLWGPN